MWHLQVEIVAFAIHIQYAVPSVLNLLSQTEMLVDLISFMFNLKRQDMIMPQLLKDIVNTSFLGILRID